MPTAAGQGCNCTHAHAIILAAVTPETTSLGEAVEGLPLYVMEGPLGSLGLWINSSHPNCTCKLFPMIVALPQPQSSTGNRLAQLVGRFAL